MKQQDRAKKKLASCLNLAKECVRYYIETKDKRFRSLRAEAMQDARYWKVVASKRDFLIY